MKKQMKVRQIVGLKEIILAVSFLALTLFMTACNTRTENSNNSSGGNTDSLRLVQTQNASYDSILYFLLDAAAKDFHDNQPPVPLGFRNVQFKYLTHPDEGKTFILCGQFLNQDIQNKEEWIHFTTIKTDPYEHWLGSNALTYCQDSKEISYSGIDLSVALKSRYDALLSKERN